MLIDDRATGIVKGKLVVPSDLPLHLSQGLFSQPGDYDLAMRYANEPSFLQDDRAPGPHGCGMKVFGVKGPFLDAVGAQTRTQDFTFNNAPVLELRDVGTALEIFTIRERNFDHKDRIEAELKKRDDTELQMAPMQLPNNHMLGYTMYSQSAYRFGDYVAKYALFPTGKTQRALAERKITDTSDPEQHSLWLREHFRDHAAEYDFRVQLLVDPLAQSVEDTSVEWDEAKYPFETVGKVSIPAGQDCFEAGRRTFWEDRMKLNVWYGMEAHRPLGSVNRLRKEVYKASAAERQKRNAVEVQAVGRIDEIP